MILIDCPGCGARVLATHKCHGRPAKLTTMPPTFRAQVAERIAEQRRPRVETPPLPFEGEGG